MHYYLFKLSHDKILHFILLNYIFIFKLIVILIVCALLRLHTVSLLFKLMCILD